MLNGIYSISERFPGVENIPTMLNLRSIGIAGDRETFGAGFMRKKQGSDFIKDSVDHYALVFVIEGEGRYVESDGTAHALSEGMVFQRLPGKVHSNYIDSSDGWFEGFIAVGRLMYNSLKAMGIIDAGNTVVAEITNEEHRIRIIKQFYNLAHKMSSFDERNILSFMADELQAIQELINIKPVRDVIEQYCEIVTHDPDRRMNIRKFCSEQSVGYEWFRKAFKQKTGMPPVSYSIRQRIESAKNLLLNSNYPIYIIADQLGYNNQYEFSAQFKKMAGVSPFAFRKQEAKI